MTKKLGQLIDINHDLISSIDYLKLNNRQLICSGSYDKTVKIVQWTFSFVKFSQYHYHNDNSNIICSSAADNTVYFWDFENDTLLKKMSSSSPFYDIIFSSFSGGRYSFFGSFNKKINLADMDTFKLIYIFKGHEGRVLCLDILPLQNNNYNDEHNIIGVIGGNGYTFCSGSDDKTIRIWDIEKASQLSVLEDSSPIFSVKYGSSKFNIVGGANTILSGSSNKKVCLWDIRSGKLIEEFNGHEDSVNCVDYSSFVVNNLEVGDSNVICPGSCDSTIRFWDIRSKKGELAILKSVDRSEKKIIASVSRDNLFRSTYFQKIIFEKRFRAYCCYQDRLNMLKNLHSPQSTTLTKIKKNFFMSQFKNFCQNDRISKFVTKEGSQQYFFGVVYFFLRSCQNSIFFLVQYE
ncbi:WD-40 repeat protein [Reticulomyxa filosa]|uniref:WD-40 repeat protein n=1 Tax=Reticulomyxa filosa TaxID=46433 RepID=X6N522_RETFI|nr:WD-40 repeat protein [Reticulomyxa filosa]|eukprot:ETO21033.1 WD-40 repeat protein [Reticulomyxa filosa]